MFARIALAVPFGAAVTGGLLFMMQLMITTGQSEVGNEVERVVDFVRVEREEAVQADEQELERPEPPQPAPSIDMPDVGGEFDSAISVAMATGPQLDFGSTIGGIGFGASDGEYLPIVKVAPIYPMRALQRGIEGYVIVEFVVTATGAVRDIVIVESTNQLFNRAALEAAEKFKYKPRVVDGVAIEVAGVTNMISFEIDQA